MKEELIQLTKAEKSPLAARNLAREYLQALILQSLQRAGAMTAGFSWRDSSTIHLFSSALL